MEPSLVWYSHSCRLCCCLAFCSCLQYQNAMTNTFANTFFWNCHDFLGVAYGIRIIGV